eukprot:TRINITY_DN11951_c0_g1_i2.p1 TRINITY_DN11951_c0_g1~~TRINITY_DN11951_c0_g1_i2.p1  ORF type:complete len:104 (+),score=15.97 TRINITY_DN11951_c0_g1_i2:256-567(+)
MVLAAVAHCGLHRLALQKLVPKLAGLHKHQRSVQHYRDVAADVAPSWFNTNPAYCLRSQFFYKHDQPCFYFIPGREHVLRKDTKIGTFFEDDRQVAKEKWQRR